MAISVTQRVTGTDNLGATGSVVVAFGGNNTAGNTIIALGWIEASINSGLSTPTDTRGNTYTQVVSINNGTASIGLVAWVANNITAGANTVTMNDGNNIANLHLYEVSGLSKTSSFDVSTFNYQLAQTSFTSGSVTTDNANELLIGAFGVAVSAAPTWSAGSGYSNLTSQNQTFLNTATEEQIVSSIAGYSATASILINGSSYSLAAILTFRDALDVIVSDTTATSESVKLAQVLTFAVSDTTITSENVQSLQSLAINTSDATVTSENVIAFETKFISVSDTTTTSENVVRQMLGFVAVSDATTTSENTIVLVPNYNINVNDLVVTIEDVAINQVVVGTTKIEAEDNASHLESVQLLVTNRISVNDLTLVTENIQFPQESFSISVSDTVITSELVDFGKGLPIAVSDTTITSENVVATTGGQIVRTLNWTITMPDSIDLTMIKLDTK